MKRSLAFPIILISLLVFAEITSYFAVKTFLADKIQLKWFNLSWFGLTVLLYTLVFGSRSIESHFAKNVLVNIFMFVLIMKLFIGLFFVFSLLIQWIPLLFKNNVSSQVDFEGRRAFSSKLALGLGAIPFSTMLYGVFVTAYDFKIHRVSVKSSKIPAPFQGFKIVQLSDIHTGSLQSEKQLQKAVDQVNQLKPDLIVFTGDLVNNVSAEALPYLPILKQLKSTYGVYSILGNHDYGDYHSWSSEQDKAANMEQMYDIHRSLNWRLLLNEHVSIQKDGTEIALLGIENWGANLNFKKYGKLNEAHQNTAHFPYKILLSHDPSHWSYEVNKAYKDIDLTLSGHTHGFQFGVEIPGFKWSPSKYIYPQWAGLYGDNEQLLYVNRGLGCLGYMGRIGIKPEITLLELENA